MILAQLLRIKTMRSIHIARSFGFALALILVSSLAIPAKEGYSQNTRIESFKRAKKEMRKIYHGSHPALYCGCEFSGRKISRKSCGYKPIRNDAKAQRIHWEHVVPASFFGRNFPSWKNGHQVCSNKGRKFRGRKCARRASAEFRRMEADMHNLYPAEGELETARKNLQMGIISGEKRRYGKCDVEYTVHTIEPRPEVRGDIARAYLYMADTYNRYLKLTAKQRKMFMAWSKADPVDAWEKKRNDRIAKVQGNSNPYISGASIVAQPPVAHSNSTSNGFGKPKGQGTVKDGFGKPYGKYGKKIKHNFERKN